MMTAMAERKFTHFNFVLSQSREEGNPPTDFRLIHQVLTSFRGILEPEEFSLYIRPYEVLELSNPPQYLGIDDDEEIAFKLEDFLNEDVETWEVRLLGEQKYVVFLGDVSRVRVCMAQYDQIIFYSRESDYMGLEQTLKDEHGFYLYKTGGNQEISSFMITKGDPVVNPEIRIDIYVQTMLIFENKHLIDPLITAVNALKELGWRVSESPTVLIPVESPHTTK